MKPERDEEQPQAEQSEISVRHADDDIEDSSISSES